MIRAASVFDDGDDEHRGRGLRRSLVTSAELRDIGAPPDVADPEARRNSIDDLAFFLSWYFPAAFSKPFSSDHLKVIGILQRVATEGGLHAFAMPRGSGKTQIAIRTALWAVLTGRRGFVSIVGATERASAKIIKALKMEVTYNAPLYADFPRELHGLPQLQGDNRKAGKQLCEGRQTLPRVGNDEITFPTIPGSLCSGAYIASCGITGNIRGQFHTLQDGRVARPDFVILDDPQTKESANSPMQTHTRIETINGDVLGMSGPDRTMAAAMPCTVIQKNDVADQVLQNPLWHGERMKMLYAFPANMKLWDTYFERRAEELRTEKTTTQADKFYVSNREELDAGAVVSWEHRHGESEVSAIQSAMHLWNRSPTAFAAEYQNDPIDETLSADAPTFAGLEAKTNRLARGTVPSWASWLTCGIDVQKSVLFYVVLAVADDFTMSVVDYAPWPEQPRNYFTIGDASPTLQGVSRSSQVEGSIFYGLDKLTSTLLGHKWQRDGGGEMTISRAIVDANWGESTDTVYEFCRRSPYSGVLIPAHGRGVRAGDKPITQYQKKPGEQLGFHWYLTMGTGKRIVRHCIHDVNHWKTFMAQRAQATAGEKGALSVFGEKPEQHRMFADHILSEWCQKTYGRAREVWEWRLKPNGENHYLDCLVMAGVAASMVGASLEEMKPSVEKKKPRRSLAELQRSKRGGR